MSKDSALIRAKKRHALACAQANRIGEALAVYHEICEVDPRDIESWFLLGNLYGRLGRLAEAEAALRKALDVEPNFARGHLTLGQALARRGRLDEALAAVRRALQLKPDYIAAKAEEANILERQGEYQGAVAVLAPLLDDYEQHPEVALVYARLCHFTQDYDGAIARLEKLAGKDGLAKERRVQVHFHLGELYERRGDFGRAFSHYQAGHRLKPGRFDAGAWQESIVRLTHIFDQEAMLRAPRAGNCSERPIFIVGMPFSGTTLVEQILARYPEVGAAGESPDIGRLAQAFHAALERTAPGNDITQMSREQCDALAQPYLDMLERRFPDAKRVIDGLARNFLHLGVIALLFPMARVIHCVRDPLDTCLSCYCHDLGSDHPYASELADLGAYYRQYQRVMSHWTAILDMPIFELRYEGLVRAPAKVARAMVEFCGLKWDRDCLRPHQEELRAAAATIGRRRHYAERLEPLTQALAGKRPS